jgi:sphingomyelin phosphodiesterase acid-like 3
VRVLRILTLALVCLAWSHDPAGAVTRPWLVISDVHYTPFEPHRKPSPFGEDTDDALLDSFLAEARAVDPDPPVVIIAGDFLAHNFRLDAAASTMVTLAKRFDAAFPRAQFVIALGNNDSSCGDYGAPIDGTFLAASAAAWAPLVDRGGAAPDFAKRFAHDGSYVARLPVRGLRVVVTNDVFDALRYGSGCAEGQDGAGQSLGRLGSDLRGAGPHERNWMLLHIPPGIDAYTTTHLTHRLGVIPFLRPRAGDALAAVAADPRNRVALAIAGHTHKFGYRLIAGPGAVRVPMLLVPSVSPIFYNGPSFLEVPVDRDGTLGDVTEFSYVGGAWQRTGDLASLGVPRFTAPELEALQGRLADDATLRATFSRLYSGGGPPEITKRNWHSYWCAATNLATSAFESCTGQRGLGVLTGRGLELALTMLGAVALAGLAFFFFLRGRGRARA